MDFSVELETSNKGNSERMEKKKRRKKCKTHLELKETDRMRIPFIFINSLLVHLYGKMQTHYLPAQFEFVPS